MTPFQEQKGMQPWTQILTLLFLTWSHFYQGVMKFIFQMSVLFSKDSSFPDVLIRQKVCRGKPTFVATKDVVCRDKNGTCGSSCQ